MILHIVLFKFYEPYQWGDDEVIDAEALTRQHPLHISEIVGWACGRNISQRAKAVDFLVMGLFENQDNLSAYLVHPNHQEGVSQWQKIASWQVIDIDIGSDTTKFFGLISNWAELDFVQFE